MKSSLTGDLKHLQGIWDIAALEVDGEPVSDLSVGNGHVKIEGDRFTSLGMTSPYRGKLSLVPGKKPKQFDLTFTAGPEKGHRNPGIYKLSGDWWTICLSTRGDKRPKAFVTTANDGFALETLKRRTKESAKSAAKNPTKTSQAAKSSKASRTATPPATVEPTGPATILEGEWAMDAAVFSGAPMDQGAVAWCRRLTRGNVTKVIAGPQTFVHATFTLDNDVSPRTIDYVNLGGQSKGKTQLGVVELRDGLLRICMAGPGKPRPKDFSSAKGDGRSYTAWRLIKSTRK